MHAVSSVTYDADGQRRVARYTNGVVNNFGYSPQRRWLLELRTRLLDDTVALALDYVRDAAGRIRAVGSDRAAQRWVYTQDELDRLTFADNLGDNSFDQSFSYDTAGNMLSNSRVGTYTYPAPGPNAVRPHAPLTASARDYSYDANGNVTGDGTRLYRGRGEPAAPHTAWER